MNNKTKIIVGSCVVLGLTAIAIALFLLANKTYNVSFDTDGGNSIPMQTVKKGEKVNKPSDPIKEEYSFVRWEYQNKEYDFTSSVKEDMTLKAVWQKNEVPVKKYKVTFNVDGKTKMIEVSEINEVNVSNLGFEQKSGYVLKWYVNGKEYDFTTPLTGDIIIEGKYEKTTNYTVNFNSNGGTVVNYQTVSVGGKATEPKNVKKEGFILDGWYLNNKKYDFNTVVTGNITLVAKWSEDPSIKKYEVKFNSDGGSNVPTQKIVENKTVTQPQTPVKDGYVFEGWYLNNNKYNFTSKVTSDITLTAKWRELVKYTVTFNSDGGSNVPAQTIVEGGKIKQPQNPTKNGYVFEGWYLNNSKYNFSLAVTNNISLVAKWRVLAKYTVTFNSDGGSNVPTQTVTEGGKVTKPQNPTKSGYTFGGWQLNGSNYNFDSAVKGNITLKAKWTKNVVKYTVTFNSDGGSSVPTQTIAEGGKATKPQNPTKDGYTFGGWQLNGSDYNFDSAIKGNITLKAKWNEISKNYTFKVSLVDDQSPDRIITVYEDGAKIDFSSIKVNGTEICTGSNPTVNKYQIQGKNSITVILKSGKSVTANLS